MNGQTTEARGALDAEAIARVREIVEAAFGPGFWDGFDAYMTEPNRYGHEWRFGGRLGFGGKVHHAFALRHRVWVSAYPEDTTPELKLEIADVNLRLLDLAFSADPSPALPAKSKEME